MAYTRALEADNLELVRLHLGDVVGRFRGEAIETSEPSLAETFELFLFPQEAVSEARETGKLRSYLQRTGAWLHLVKSREKPLGVAHSSAAGSARVRWSVQSFFLSPLAPKLVDAIAQIDAVRTSESIEVMLIAMPSYQLDFFLLVDGETSEAYIVSAPDGSQELAEGQFYTEEELLRHLSSITPRTGILTNQES